MVEEKHEGPGASPVGKIGGGFFSAESNPQHTSPFGFLALSAMVGMFSEQAVLKLKEIAETLLSKPPAGKDSKPQFS
jgi:hypothetical protein